jgi:hypothetical protein
MSIQSIGYRHFNEVNTVLSNKLAKRLFLCQKNYS